MESNSESPIIIQMLKNVKQIIELSKGRDCWSSDELKNINITYHNVSEIVRQLQEKQTEERDGQNKQLDESVEMQGAEQSEEQSDEEMEDVD
tara:strand:- start:607 stop:882 length:276 start_codon:yes stop_codon:yes gene_type:complete